MGGARSFFLGFGCYDRLKIAELLAKSLGCFGDERTCGELGNQRLGLADDLEIAGIILVVLGLTAHDDGLAGMPFERLGKFIHEMIDRSVTLGSQEQAR